MAKFKVELIRHLPQIFTVIVDAETPELAEELAWGLSKQENPDPWVGDLKDEITFFDCYSCEECDPADEA
jgi:hypothetical protein